MEKKFIGKRYAGKIIFSCIALFFIIAFSTAFYKIDQMNKLESFKSEYGTLATNLPNYKYIDSQKYVRDGKLCMAYRVVTKKNLSDNDLYKIFYHVCNDNYYLHTIWFYSDPKKAGNSEYDVAMLDETDRSKWPEITR